MSLVVNMLFTLLTLLLGFTPINKVESTGSVQNKSTPGVTSEKLNRKKKSWERNSSKEKQKIDKEKRSWEGSPSKEKQ